MLFGCLVAPLLCSSLNQVHLPLVRNILFHVCSQDCLYVAADLLHYQYICLSFLHHYGPQGDLCDHVHVDGQQEALVGLLVAGDVLHLQVLGLF